MPLMFMIAGYVQGMKDYRAQSWLHWLKKSAVDLYLPCMYFSLIQWSIMCFIFSRHNPANFGALKSGDLVMIPIQGFKEYWFLAALFFIKVLHSAFECSSYPGKLHSVFWTAVFIFHTLLGNAITAGISYGLYFHIGYILKRKDYISPTRKPGTWAGLMLFIMGSLFFFIPYAYDTANALTKICAAIFSCLGLFAMFYAFEIKYSLLITCGLYSMVIYCLHNWITACFRMIFTVSGMSSSAEPVLMFVTAFVPAMVLPIFCVYVYKHVKCLRWVEYIFYPGKLIRK